MMKKIRVEKFLFFLIFSVPLDTPKDWQLLEYTKIPPHKVEFNQRHLKVHVKASAMPLIFSLKGEKRLKAVQIEGHVDRLVTLSQSSKNMQGEKKWDDYVFSLGLVKPGSRTMSFWEKNFAPNWIKTLFSLAPKGAGVDHVLFYRVYQEDGVDRKIHPHRLGKGLIKIKNEWLLKKAGDFNLNLNFKTPQPTLALWLSSDGDDTGSEFTLILKKITLIYEKQTPTDQK